MRGILIDWIIDVHKKFKLNLETLFLSVNLVDRICNLKVIAKHRFQLLGITCLFIASKYEEIYPPFLSDFAFVCAEAYSESDILSMEAEVLKLVDFNLVHTSSIELIEAYCEESKLPQRPNLIE
jgi:cyclin B